MKMVRAMIMSATPPIEAPMAADAPLERPPLLVFGVEDEVDVGTEEVCAGEGDEEGVVMTGKFEVPSVVVVDVDAVVVVTT